MTPMLGASAGAWLDERWHLGFTTWRSACRASGLRLATLVDFTLQLLPLAVLGLLLGGLLVVLAGMCLRHRPGHVRRCLAAHAGCALSLPIALLLCATTLPLPLMMLADLAITAFIVAGLLWLLRPAPHDAVMHP
jgi:hypothetical protein